MSGTKSKRRTPQPNASASRCPRCGSRLKPVYRFNADLFNEIAEKMGHNSFEQQANFLHVGTSTLWRVVQGKAQPGNKFMSAVSAALPNVPFSDLFELTEAAR